MTVRRTIATLCLASFALTGCDAVRAFFPGANLERKISTKGPVEVLKPKDGVETGTSGTFIPVVFRDPPVVKKNAATGQFINGDTGEVLRGTLEPQPGDPPLPESAPQALVTTTGGVPANYIDAGNSIFVETKGLKPETEYMSTLHWPNGKKTEQAFTSSAGGNIQTALGNFLEFPHVGFHQASVDPNKDSVVAGKYRVEIADKSGNVVQTIYFAVRARPVLFITNKDNQERSIYFADYSEELFLHGEGFPPESLVNVWVIKGDVNRLNPMTNGLALEDKVLDNLKNIRFQADANGRIHTKLLSWGKRDAVEQSLVVVGKYLNDEPKFVMGEDIAIIDHPTFVIKNSKDYFQAVGAGAEGVIKGSQAGDGTPAL